MSICFCFLFSDVINQRQILSRHVSHYFWSSLSLILPQIMKIWNYVDLFVYLLFILMDLVLSTEKTNDPSGAHKTSDKISLKYIQKCYIYIALNYGLHCRQDFRLICFLWRIVFLNCTHKYLLVLILVTQFFPHKFISKYYIAVSRFISKWRWKIEPDPLGWGG